MTALRFEFRCWLDDRREIAQRALLLAAVGLCAAVLLWCLPSPIVTGGCQ